MVAALLALVWVVSLPLRPFNSNEVFLPIGGHYNKATGLPVTEVSMWRYLIIGPAFVFVVIAVLSLQMRRPGEVYKRYGWKIAGWFLAGLAFGFICYLGALVNINVLWFTVVFGFIGMFIFIFTRKKSG